MTLVVGGQKGNLVATVSPSNAANKAVNWTSSNNTVATVSGGVVTPLKAGSTTITATTLDGNKKATCVVTVETAPISVTGVTLNQPSMTLVAGGATGTLSATVAPANATNKAVVWYSSDVAVATVNEGVVTPLKAGTTTITVKTLDGNKSATSTVTVEAAPIAVEGITLNKETMTLVVDGANSELVATIVPMEATNKTIEWSSSNNDVATVTDGLVTPLKAGTTTITATTKDRGYKATCEVIVIDKAILTLIAGDKSVLVVHNNGDPLTSNTAASLDNINQWKQLGANGDLEARFVNAPNNFGSLILTPNHTNNTVTITATRRLLRSVSGLVTVEIRDKENPDLVATFTVQVNSRAGSTSLNIGEVKVK